MIVLNRALIPLALIALVLGPQPIGYAFTSWNTSHLPVSSIDSRAGKRDLNNTALIILDADSVQAMKRAVRFIKAQGGEIIHMYPTHVLIGYVPRNVGATVIGQMGILEVIYDAADVKKVSKYGKSAEAAVEAWNNNFKGKARLKGLEPPAGFKDPPPIAGDLKMRPNSTNRTSAAPMSSRPQQALVPGFYDTSEYFMGEVMVGIILPESTGGSENWDTSRQNNVVSEIQAAMNWWADRDPNARLTFVYDIDLSASTTYEPITLPQSSEGLWIGDVMAGLGYASGGYFDRVYSYLNARRTALGTDWAFAIFVVDSLNDADGYFSDGAYFAYAYLGGPFQVMTYDNDNYGIFSMDAVTAHETGHIFYALDQYTSAGYGCTARSGYLNIQNQNSAYPAPGSCLSNVASIMRGQVAPYTAGAVDTYARQQIGWRDTDLDTVMDILDFEPQTILNSYTPDPTIDNTPTFTGTATASSSVYPNNNPYGGNAVTINKIAMVQYRVDSGTWTGATATDGDFDETNEDFTFTTSPLSDGPHTIDARAVHSGGAADSTPASDTLTIIIQYQLTISVNPSSAGFTSPAVGSYTYDAGSSIPVSATPTGGYSFYYWNLDGANAGSSSAISVLMNSAHSLTAYFRGTSTISLTALPSSASPGATVVLSGAITVVHTSPGIPPGTNVFLTFSTDGGTTWNFLMSTASNSTGGYSIVWYPPSSASYQLRASWSGDANYEGATSNTATLSVTGSAPPKISLIVSGPSSSARGSTATFDVVIGNSGSTLTTVLYIEVKGPGGYVYFDTLQVTIGGNGFSRFQLTWQVPSTMGTGTYRVSIGLIPPTSTSISQTQTVVT